MLTFDQGLAIAQQMFVLGSVEDFKWEEILEVLQTADDLYTNDGESFITDTQYDTLKQYAHGLNPGHVYFTGVGSSVRGGKIKLPHKMGSLTQAYEGDIVKWVEKYNLQKQPCVITEKLDGVSVLIVYGEGGRLQIAYSRGDGVEGADVTRHISKIEGVPIRVAEREPIAIRAEVIISKKNFEKVRALVKSRSGRPYKNARNMIAGIMNAESNPDIVYDYIDVVAYEVINGKHDKEQTLDLLHQDNQFVVPRYIVLSGEDLTDDNLPQVLNTFRNESEYEIDGIVIEVDNANLRKKINPTKDTLNPEYARKYKIADASNYAEPTIVDIELNVSKDGYVKPVLVFTPVELVGVTISRCTGFNMKFIRDNEIQPGTKIRLIRSGDTIPFCQGIASSGELTDRFYDEWFYGFVATKVGSVRWNATNVDLVLEDAHTNDTVMFEQLNDFFATIDAPHLREGNLEAFYTLGFTTPEAIIELTQEDICSVLNSIPIGKKVFKGLHEALTNIPLYKLMGAHAAFGRGVGVRKMKKLYEAFEGDMSKCTDFNAIINVDGFDKKTATKIVAGYPAFEAFLKKVSKYVDLAPYEAKRTGVMSGQQVVFTGFRSKELENLVEELGGKMGSSVTSKTTLVVTTDKNSNTGKVAKATELGIRIVDVDEFNKMLGA